MSQCGAGTRAAPGEEPSQQVRDLAASFQLMVVRSLRARLRAALDRHDVRSILLAGGVASNSALRDAVEELGRKRRVAVYKPSPILTTDNAAMIAAAGYVKLAAGVRDSLDLNADPSWRLATPLRTIRRHRLAQDLAALAQVVRERDAGALVVGWPLNMDGSEGPRCQSVHAFATRLDEALALPILLWDERLTTFAAEEAADRAGLRGETRAEALDAFAAATILQDALDAVARAERQARRESGSSRISSRRA